MNNRRLRFNKRSLDALPSVAANCRSTGIEYTDALEPGLKAVKYKSQRISFRHRFIYHERKEMITIGSFPAITVDVARAVVRANKALLAQGVNPKEAQQVISSPSFTQFLDDDFIPYAMKKYKTYQNIKSIIHAHLMPCFGKRIISDISKADIVRYHESLCDEISPVTANRCLSMLSSIFKRAVDLELLPNNPATGVKKFYEGEGRDRFLNDAELDRFIHVLKQRIDNMQVRAIFLLLTLGLRRSEVLSSKWSNIDLAQRRLFIPDPKNRKPRYVALNSQAHALLETMAAERNQGVDWVFPSKSECGHLLEIRKTFASILKQANITEFRLHDVRRTMASHLINSGASIYEVKEILGHQDLRSTQVYARLATASIAKTSEIMSRKVDEVMNMATI